MKVKTEMERVETVVVVIRMTIEEARQLRGELARAGSNCCSPNSCESCRPVKKFADAVTDEDIAKLPPPIRDARLRYQFPKKEKG